MKISGQNIIVTSTHFIVELHEPFWSAYQKYGWEDRVEGFGISKELVDKAEKENKKIIVRYKGDYEISPKKARKTVNLYHSVFIARNNKLLGIIPRTAFTKIPPPIKAEISMDVRAKLAKQFRERYL